MKFTIEKGLKNMKLLMMMFDGCPYCAQARSWMNELCKEDPRYAAVSVKTVDEHLEPEFADTLDYYNVPTYFLTDDEGKIIRKLHEGAATKEKIRAVFDAAL
jgi:glutaredoxin